MKYLKWAEGAHEISWFLQNGNTITDNTFKISTTGLHTILYENPQGGKRVYTFNALKEKPPVIGDPVHYSFTINDALSDATTRITYGHDCATFTPAKFTVTQSSIGSGTLEENSWANKFPFNAIKPCVMKDGVVKYYLNPAKFTQKADGTPSNLTGADGDVMIEFPLIYWKASKEGSKTTVEVSNTELDNTFKALAHTANGETFAKLYISSYDLADFNGVASSISGKGALFKNINDARTSVKQNSNKYNLMTFHSLEMFRILYTLFYKSTDKRAVAIGKNTPGRINSGLLNDYGMTNGSTSNAQPVKHFGLENMTGNNSFLVEGLYAHPTTGNIWVSNQNFNNSATGYTDTGLTVKNMWNLTGRSIKEVYGQTNCIFVPSTLEAATYQFNKYTSNAQFLTGGSNPKVTFCAGGVASNISTENENGIFKLELQDSVQTFSMRMQCLTD